MSLLGTVGFEAQSTARDRLSVAAGAVVYAVDVPPGGSARSATGDFTATRPWLNNTAGPLEPTGNVTWLEFHFKKGVNDINNSNTAIGTQRNGTEQVTFSMEPSGLRAALRINGFTVATAAANALSLGAWERVIMKIDTDAATYGTVDIYLNGDLSSAVLSYVMIIMDYFGLGGKPNGWWFRLADASDHVDDCIAMDPAGGGTLVSELDLLQASVKPQVFTGNGLDTGWTGSYTDIDELPANDSDNINTTATDTRSSFTKPAIAEDRVLGVQLMARVTRTGAAAGVNMEVYEKQGGLDTDSGIQAAPGDGDVQAIFDTQRDGSLWTASAYDAHEFGFVSRT